MSEVEQFSPYKRIRYSRSEQAEARMKFGGNMDATAV